VPRLQAACVAKTGRISRVAVKGDYRLEIRVPELNFRRPYEENPGSAEALPGIENLDSRI
jgi:hypothetical protein